jgi:hypothetical protein
MPGGIGEQICAFKVDDDLHEFSCWMTKEDEVKASEFNGLLAAARLREDAILKSKGDDYTIDQADADRLFNFKEIAALVGITPQQVWAVYFLKHVFSILAYIKGKKESEPIQGRKDDSVNYLHLFEGLVLEDESGEISYPGKISFPDDLPDELPSTTMQRLLSKHGE